MKPDYPYEAKRGFSLLLVGFVLGLVATALVPPRIQNQLKLEPQTVATVSGLVFVGLDFLRHSRFSKGQKQHFDPVVAPVRVLEDLNRGRRR